MLLNRHFKKSISGLLYSDLLILVCPRQVQIIYHVYAGGGVTDPTFLLLSPLFMYMSLETLGVGGGGVGGGMITFVLLSHIAQSTLHRSSLAVIPQLTLDRFHLQTYHHLR